MVGIIGHMSGGKSYTTVRYMLDNLKTGHVVASNIRLRCRGVTTALNIPCVFWKRNYFYLKDLDKGETLGFNELSITDYESWPCGSPRGSATYKQDMVYIYIDEASSVWDSLLSVQNSDIQEVSAWARHSEKRGQMIFLIAQFLSEIHKRLRNHIREVHLCKNAAHVRLPIIKTHLPGFLRNYVLVSVCDASSGEQYESTQWCRIDPLIYHCYDTGQIVVGGGNSNRVNYVKYVPNLMEVLWPKIIIMHLVACFLLTFLSFALFWKSRYLDS